jgi:hypothetical protein
MSKTCRLPQKHFRRFSCYAHAISTSLSNFDYVFTESDVIKADKVCIQSATFDHVGLYCAEEATSLVSFTLQFAGY